MTFVEFCKKYDCKIVKRPDIITDKDVYRFTFADNFNFQIAIDNNDLIGTSQSVFEQWLCEDAETTYLFHRQNPGIIPDVKPSFCTTKLPRSEFLTKNFNIPDELIIGYDVSSKSDLAILSVSRIDEHGKRTFVNSFVGDEATRMFTNLVTVKNKGW